MSLTALQPDNRGESCHRPVLPSEDDEDTSMLADLVAMFPSLDHEVIVSVLQAHDGRIQAAVEYLMSSSSEDNGQLANTALGTGYFEPAHDMVGQFSDDIGGLPELLPRCLYEDESPDEEEEGEGGHGSVAEECSNSDSPPGYLDVEDDPLPTYEEACREQLLSQSQSSLNANLVEPQDETEPLGAAGRSSPILPKLLAGQHKHTPSPGLDELMSGQHTTSLNTKKSKYVCSQWGVGVHASCFVATEKGKKLYKIASKLNPRKKSNGVMQEKTGSNGSAQQYQPLIDGVCGMMIILMCQVYFCLQLMNCWKKTRYSYSYVTC